MKYLFFLMVTFCFWSCGKDEPTANKVIAGKAYYKNRFSKDSSLLTPLANQEVFVKRQGSLDENYAYKVLTNNNGDFYIDVSVIPATVYTKSIMEVSTGVMASFYGKQDLTGSETNITLIADVDSIKQNGFIMNLTDVTGGSFSNAKVYLFNNSTIAAANDTANAIDSFLSDAKGQIFKTNIAAGNYFLNSTKIVDNSVYQRLGKQITVSTTGFSPADTMILQKVVSAYKNGFTITAKDSLNGNIPNVRMYMYSSLLYAANNDSTGAVGIFVSDLNGKVIRNSFPAGDYYLNAIQKIDTSVYERFLKQLIIPITGFVQDTIVLKKKIPVIQNGFTISVRDSLGGSISNAAIYLYTSQVLASSNDPAIAIDVSTTDNYGNYSKNNLLSGNYYINATKKADTLTYQRLGKPIFVPVSGNVSDTLVVRKM